MAVSSVLNNSLFLTRKFGTSKFTGTVQVRYEWRGKDTNDNAIVASSGGQFVFISPQINYSLQSIDGGHGPRGE